MTATSFPALLQRFFTERLCTQMEASRHTVAGYRDTFRLLIRFASAQCGKLPTKLEIEDLGADLIADFLVHVETARGNAARSRNTRLAAIRSFFRYVAMSDPAWLLHCQRILAMPNKRYVKRTVTFLDGHEIMALLSAPDRTTWAGRRDHALLLVALQTGLRASELVGLRWRRRSGNRCAYPLHRQGQEGAEHTASARHGEAAASLDRRGARQCRSALPLDPGRSAEPRCAGASGAQALPHGVENMPDPDRQARHAAYPAAQHCDGVAASRRRSIGDRPLA